MGIHNFSGQITVFIQISQFHRILTFDRVARMESSWTNLLNMQAAESFWTQWTNQFLPGKNAILKQGTEQELEDKKISTKELERKL